jgi:hypothetical protein
MREQRVFNWKRLLVESSAIVASILMAFAIDAWWENRESQKSLNMELTNVISELRENKALVELQIAVLGNITVSRRSLLNAMDANKKNTYVSVPGSLAWLSTAPSPTLDASFGALDTIVSSGRMARIDDPKLRSGLAGIKSKFEDVLEEQLEARAVHNAFVLPLLIEKADLRALYQDDIEYSQVLYSSSANAEISSKRSFEYPNNMALRNAIAETNSWYESGRAEMNELLIDIEALVARLESELQ